FLPIPAKTIACGRVIEREGGSKTAPFTLPLPGACIIFEGCAFCNSPIGFRPRAYRSRSRRIKS
ncbi:MAG: hypothetical protein II437_04415, partial [Oscillospiraceae bacterium]|nr:hypothetical protein [Oscillospiraceae bacterium]